MLYLSSYRTDPGGANERNDYMPDPERSTRQICCSAFKLLRVDVSNDLKWTEHVRAVTSNASSRLHYSLKQLKRAAGCAEGDLM